jgi:glyoxylase-like metal-dependent hydrolase (beta-lactamase superfamily II)
VTQIDAFVATHYHEDHVGGIDDLVDMGVAVGERFDRGDKACCSPRRGTGAPARAGSRPTPRRSRRVGDLAALAIAHVEAPEHEAAAVEVDARGRRL